MRCVCVCIVCRFSGYADMGMRAYDEEIGKYHQLETELERAEMVRSPCVHTAVQTRLTPL